MLEVGGLRQEEKVKNKRRKAEGRGTMDEGREKIEEGKGKRLIKKGWR